jgi:hypothetical protein
LQGQRFQQARRHDRADDAAEAEEEQHRADERARRTASPGDHDDDEVERVDRQVARNDEQRVRA